jgi:propanol-preferring alcohol dehydrogenase
LIRSDQNQQQLFTNFQLLGFDTKLIFKMKALSSLTASLRGNFRVGIRCASGLALKMKAATIQNHGDKFVVKDVPVPVPKAGEILVRIRRTGCCHTDVHAIDGDWPVLSKLPLIPGHEGVGEVVAIGPNVTTRKLGDKVGIFWLHSACGVCEFCVTGNETVCFKQQNTGYSVDGTFGQYAIATASHSVAIPDALDYDQAAPILCAGVTAYKALKVSEARAGDFVTIIGAGGGLGHLAIQYAKAMGLRVIAIDVGDDKMKYCMGLGAEFAVDASKPDAAAQVMKYTKGGSHVVCCFATNPKAFKLSIDVSRRLGTVVAVGLPAGDFSCPVFDIVLKRVTICGSIVGDRQDMKEAISFASRGGLY